MCVVSEDGLNRVESAVTASASGDLCWGHWTHDCVVALGLSGRRNPLGFAVVRYLSDPPSAALAWGVVLNLVQHLLDRGCDKSVANDAAWQAFEYWRDSRCRSCFGRGFVGDVHRACPACGGTGRRSVPDGCDLVRDAVSALLDAEQWMEGQLRARMRFAA